MSAGFQNPSGVLPKTGSSSELFRADLISAMKVPDSHQLELNSFVEIKEAWRTEWEAGVQVCANELPRISFKHGVRSIGEASNSLGGSLTMTRPNNVGHHPEFKLPPNYMKGDNPSQDGNNSLTNSEYELDELDTAWLDSVNKTRKYRVLTGANDLSDDLLQKAMTHLERKCYQNMLQAIKTEEELRIEFDESVVCDVCRDPEREENNEMIFCDSCNVCVHQACYGVLMIPEGSWVCKPCGSHAQTPPCSLCPNRSGAMKRVKPNPGWAHLSCALWIPEVKLSNVDRMEPITNIEGIPASRWNLLCSVCKKREGACIQCSYPRCLSAYHVTCGFQAGLEMRTKLTSSKVVHESYCAKHTTLRKTPTKNSNSAGITANKMVRNGENGQLKYLLDRFHEYSSVQELSKSAPSDLPLPLATLIRNYWVLKRKSMFNRPLIPELQIDFTLQRLPSEVKYDKSVADDEDFLTIVHARQNLEKARNLVYMVQRRERLKRQSIVLSEEATRLELRLLDEEVQQQSNNCNQPLGLKRLDVIPPSDKPPLAAENGDDVFSSNNTSDSDTADSCQRLLRKKKNSHISNNSDGHHLPVSLSPKRCRRKLSEGCAATMDGTVTLHSTNGQLPEDNGVPVSFKQHC